MAATTIEWTESTWNPETGCTKISPGCRNCYAERMAKRLQHMGQARYAQGFAVACHPEALGLPLRWRRPQMVFVNSMSDLFHEDVPDDFLRAVFEVMAAASWHRFQVLTKRSERLVALAPSLSWPNNVWIGVSVEARGYLKRVEDLRAVPGVIRFAGTEA